MLHNLHSWLTEKLSPFFPHSPFCFHPGVLILLWLTAWLGENPSLIKLQLFTCLNFQWTKWDLFLQAFRVKWRAIVNPTNGAEVLQTLGAVKLNCQDDGLSGYKLDSFRLCLFMGDFYNFWFVLRSGLTGCMIQAAVIQHLRLTGMCLWWKNEFWPLRKRIPLTCYSNNPAKAVEGLC